MTAGLGRFGEAWAVAHLQRQGYRIIERNVRLGRDELDIVARDGADLVFVEVKCRRSSQYGSPEESISPRRFDRLARAAGAYLSLHGLENASVRLDLVAIMVTADGRVASCNLIRGLESPRRT